MGKVSRYLLAALFIGSGTLHLTRPKPFRAIMPPQIPEPDAMVAISGVAEILGGFGILIPATRPAASWGLIALLAAVFPANVHMALEHVEPDGMQIPSVLLWARLSLQPLLMWWVFTATRQKKGREQKSQPWKTTY
jgi:uncharacterized membrane protein